MEAVIEDQDAAGTLASLARLGRVKWRPSGTCSCSWRTSRTCATPTPCRGTAAGAGRVFTGMERVVSLGGVETPLVRSSPPPRWPRRLEISTYAARALIADVLGVRHRLPRLWARVVACEVATWVARKVAVATRT